MNDISKWYGILGVNLAASPKTIKAAYRELAQLWHPDCYMNDPELKARAEIEIKEINRAYTEIKAYLASGVNAEAIAGRNASGHDRDSRTKVVKTVKNADFYYQQGVIFAEQQQLDEALSNFALAIKHNSDYLEAYQYRGFILSQQGFNLRADAEFKKAHQIKLKQRVQNPSPYDVYAGKTSKTSVDPPDNALRNCHSIAAGGAVTSLVIGLGGCLASAGAEREIQLWQVDSGRAVGSLKGHQDLVTCLTLSISGETLISGSGDRTIKFWDLRTKKLRQTLTGDFNAHLSAITAIAVSPDNRMLLSCDRENSLKIWQLDRARVIKNISFTTDVTCLAIDPPGKLFCSGGLEPQIRLRQLKDGQIVRSIDNNSGVLSIAFSPDGKLFATGGLDRTIKVWNVATGKQICILKGHGDRISQVIFAPNNTLISSSLDGKIALWDLTTELETQSIQAHSSGVNTMNLSNQQVLATGGKGSIKIWQCNFL